MNMHTLPPPTWRHPFSLGTANMMSMTSLAMRRLAWLMLGKEVLLMIIVMEALQVGLLLYRYQQKLRVDDCAGYRLVRRRVLPLLLALLCSPRNSTLGICTYTIHIFFITGVELFGAGNAVHTALRL